MDDDPPDSPAPPPAPVRSGVSQISLADLMITVFIIATSMALWNMRDADTFVPGGIAVSVLVGLLYLYCLTTASRHRIAKLKELRRYAIGMMLSGFGCIGTGVGVITAFVYGFTKNDLWCPLFFFTSVAFCIFMGGIALQERALDSRDAE